jgi:nitronate monooxygenase
MARVQPPNLEGGRMTRFTDLIGCRLPIQQAGMSGPATPTLARAVAAAGGLGMIGIGRQTRAVVEQYIADVQGAPGVVGCTMIAPFVRDEVAELAADQFDVIEFFYDWPEARRVPVGPIVGWQVGSVDEARAAVDAGCSYVIAQGFEAGGHVRGTMPLRELLAGVRAAVDVPVVAAGGIGTRADVAAAMDAGADAVRVGTRFVVCEESNAHPQYIDALVAATATDTVLTEAFGVGWPNAPHRVLRSAIERAETSPDEVGATATADGQSIVMPRFGVSVPTREATGDIAAMALYAGTSVDAVHNTPTAAEVIAELCGRPQ